MAIEALVGPGNELPVKALLTHTGLVARDQEHGLSLRVEGDRRLSISALSMRPNGLSTARYGVLVIARGSTSVISL